MLEITLATQYSGTPNGLVSKTKYHCYSLPDIQQFPLANSRRVEEIYVDGDEIALLFGLKESTHCWRGVTLTGTGVHGLYLALRDAHNKKRMLEQNIPLYDEE